MTWGFVAVGTNEEPSTESVGELIAYGYVVVIVASENNSRSGFIFSGTSGGMKCFNSRVDALQSGHVGLIWNHSEIQERQ